MASETTFDHWKVVFSWKEVGKTQFFFQNPLESRFWALGFLIYTLSCANFKKNPPWQINFVSLHVPATSGYSPMQCNDSETEVLSRFWSLSLVETLRLKFVRYFEAEDTSVKALNHITMCLWQSFSFTPIPKTEDKSGDKRKVVYIHVEKRIYNSKN